MIELEAPARTKPIEPTTPMSISQAIRLGALVTTPAVGVLAYTGPDGIRSACAVGAALIGAGEGEGLEL